MEKREGGRRRGKDGRGGWIDMEGYSGLREIEGEESDSKRERDGV